MLENEVLNTIKKFYPEGISAYSDRYEFTPEFIFHKSFSKDVTQKMLPQWDLFKQQLPHSLYLLDYSALPGFNKCFELNFSYKNTDKEKYYIVYYVSVLYPSYCYFICDYNNNANPKYSECAISMYDFISSINCLIEERFAGYRLMRWTELREFVKNYSLQTPDPWKSKVFNFLFTEDPRFDKYL